MKLGTNALPGHRNELALGRASYILLISVTFGELKSRHSPNFEPLNNFFSFFFMLWLNEFYMGNI